MDEWTVFHVEYITDRYGIHLGQGVDISGSWGIMQNSTRCVCVDPHGVIARKADTGGPLSAVTSREDKRLERLGVR